MVRMEFLFKIELSTDSLSVQSDGSQMLVYVDIIYMLPICTQNFALHIPSLFTRR